MTDWKTKYRRLLGETEERLSEAAERVRQGTLTADSLEAVADTWEEPESLRQERLYVFRRRDPEDGQLVATPESQSEQMEQIYPEGDPRRDWIRMQMEDWARRRQR